MVPQFQFIVGVGSEQTQHKIIIEFHNFLLYIIFSVKYGMQQLEYETYPCHFSL